MRFDRHIRSAPYVNRRDQFRMLGMVGLLALVLVLIQVVRRPASWNWLFALSGLSVAEEQDAPAEGELRQLKPIEIRRKTPAAPLGEDEFYAHVGEAPSPDTPAAAPQGAAGGPGIETPRTPPTAEDSTQHPPVSAGDRLSAEMLSGVVDDWMGMTREEQAALLRVADHLDVVDAASLSAAGDRQVTLDSLLADPDYFRGRPVTITGRLKRFVRGKIGTPDETLPVWEAWVITGDSRGVPLLVLCLTPPTGMPQGESIDEIVTASGYFLRRFAYASRGGEALTALLFAPSLEWRPAGPPLDQQVKREMNLATVIFVAVGGLGLVALLVWFARSDRRFRRSRSHSIAESRLDASANELAALGDLDGGDPHRIQIDDSLLAGSATAPSELESPDRLSERTDGPSNSNSGTPEASA